MTEISSSEIPAIDHYTYTDENEILKELNALAGLSPDDRQMICARGAALVSDIRRRSSGLQPELVIGYRMFVNACGGTTI